MRILFLLSLFAAALAAQQTVAGRVLDPSGAPVPKASVKLVSESGAEVKAVASAEGDYRFEAVADGSYLVSAKTDGLKSDKQALTVAGSDTKLDIHLAVSAGADSVTVAAASSKLLEEAIDPERNADRLNFEDELLDALPAPGGDALSVVSTFLSPAAQGSEGVTVVVDGVEMSASSLPASSIRRIRVNRNPYSPRYRRPGKARVDVYSEEGSLRRYRASFGISARNSALDARNFFAPVKPPMNRVLVDGNLSVPLRQRRTSLYVNGEHYRNNEMAIVNARTLDGPFQANVPTPERRSRFLGRLENVGEAHQITLQYSLLDQSEQNRSAGGLRLPEQGYPVSVRASRVQFSDRTLLGGRILNDFRLVAQRETAMRGADADSPAIQVHGAFTSGPSQTFWQRRETGIRIQESATIAAGRHTIRIGGEGRPGFYDSFERSLFGGLYEFADLDAYASRRALIYRVNRGDPNIALRQHEAFGYIQDEARVGRGISLTYGARYSWQSDVRDRNNIAPRIGVAFAPGSGRTVIRGGAGLFHSRVSEDVNRRAQLWNGDRIRETVYQNVPFPFAASSGFATVPPPSVWRRADVVAPVMTQASVSVEQQVAARSTLAVEYQHLRGSSLLRSRNVNGPVAGFRPDPNFVNIYQVESTASMQSNALAATLRTSAGKWLSGMFQYTLSRTTDDTAGTFEFPAGAQALSAERGRADYDRRHRFNSAATAELPKGFRIGSFVSLATGSSYNITTGRDDNGDSIINDRPQGVTRNTGHGPGLVQVDLRIMKSFAAPRFLDRSGAGSTRNLEVSVDVFNVLNRVNYDGFSGVLTSPFFGGAYAALPPRTVQISLRYKL